MSWQGPCRPNCSGLEADFNSETERERDRPRCSCQARGGAAAWWGQWRRRRGGGWQDWQDKTRWSHSVSSLRCHHVKVWADTEVVRWWSPSSLITSRHVTSRQLSSARLSPAGVWVSSLQQTGSQWPSQCPPSQSQPGSAPRKPDSWTWRGPALAGWLAGSGLSLQTISTRIYEDSQLFCYNSTLANGPTPPTNWQENNPIIPTLTLTLHNTLHLEY